MPTADAPPRRISWRPIPGTRRRPDAEVPGPWSPLLALAPRLRAVLELARRVRAHLAGTDATPPEEG